MAAPVVLKAKANASLAASQASIQFLVDHGSACFYGAVAFAMHLGPIHPAWAGLVTGQLLPTVKLTTVSCHANLVNHVTHITAHRVRGQ